MYTAIIKQMYLSASCFLTKIHAILVRWSTTSIVTRSKVLRQPNVGNEISEEPWVVHPGNVVMKLDDQTVDYPASCYHDFSQKSSSSKEKERNQNNNDSF